MNTQFLRYEREADDITSKDMTPASRARLQFLLSAMKTTRELGTNSLPTANGRDLLAFRKKFMLPEEQQRTYVPLNETDNGQIIPSNFEVQLKNLMIEHGPFYAGSPLLSNLYGAQMRSVKIAVNDDTDAEGVTIDENTTPANDSELLGLGSVSIGGSAKLFSSGIQLASTSLVDDVSSWTSFESLILKTVSPRLSEVQNRTFFGQLKTALGSNSSASVDAAGATVVAADVYTLLSAVGSAYRASAQAAWVMSPAMQTALGALKMTSGQREFPRVLEAQPTILGYPVFVVASAADSDILMGDFSYFFVKSTPVQLRVLRERFTVNGYVGYILGESAQGAWTVAADSDSPVKTLAFS